MWQFYIESKEGRNLGTLTKVLFIFDYLMSQKCNDFYPVVFVPH